MALTAENYVIHAAVSMRTGGINRPSYTKSLPGSHAAHNLAGGCGGWRQARTHDLWTAANLYRSKVQVLQLSSVEECKKFV